MDNSMSDGLTDAVRRFQWFYARHVRAPHELVEHSALSLTEMRVLFAVMHAVTCTAADISRTLGLDTGYLSRMLTCVFRMKVTGRFGIVTGRFGNVTGRFGNVTERTGQQDWRCA